VDLGTRSTFPDIAKTIADVFNSKTDFKAKSFYDLIK
jgi:phosphopentomutase